MKLKRLDPEEKPLHDLDPRWLGEYDPTAADTSIPTKLANAPRLKMTVADVLEQNLPANKNFSIIVPATTKNPDCYWFVTGITKKTARYIEAEVDFHSPTPNPLGVSVAFIVRMNPKARLHIIVNQ